MKNSNKTKNTVEKKEKKMLMLSMVFILIGAILASAFILGFVYQDNNATVSSAQRYPGPSNMPNANVLNAQSAPGTASIPIVAVSSTTGVGKVGNVTVKFIPGTGDTLVDTTPFTEPDIQFAMNQAVAVAENVTGKYLTNTDFVFDYQVDANVIGGESAGGATAIATIAALEGKQLNPDVIMTGTIDENGTIGPVAGLVEKAQAAQAAGYKYFLVPQGQSVVTYYDQVTQNAYTPRGRHIYYDAMVQKTENLSDAVNGTMQIIEVANIADAEKYFFK